MSHPSITLLRRPTPSSSMLTSLSSSLLTSLSLSSSTTFCRRQTNRLSSRNPSFGVSHSRSEAKKVPSAFIVSSRLRLDRKKACPDVGTRDFPDSHKSRSEKEMQVKALKFCLLMLIYQSSIALIYSKMISCCPIGNH